ncbi:UDP-N-acetyl-D-glucosamine 2-epimerase, UDP-hydrolysing [Pseudodesulfovibrio mercurii]|uniref:UDP-N-acetyl-D-glucosamine 2-epimerase, UDP-hydrolysing n=1 Tax=Pseudodesulfovibrio mercurii TaxID=641491 RepID=F0JH57_9BACT|nr:UDP-N-acetylglucosamine 2-epimerase [Pseudodesulfovibrio mercurii]EGB13996.1 UDP-N-acetyl-D-glucosamine 2-epimerase, UDP-hydrolysing [Pseudodesulfovibrio mercurii]
MKICVFTGTRAEYGLLTPLLKRIQDDPDTELRLLVSGSHLSERHGHTVDAIRADGFPIGAEVPLPLKDDSRLGVALAMGEAVSGCARALDAIAPDLLVLLGDRWECLACAEAAALLRIPVAHIHGGETTEGAVDEQFRHAVTKLSRLHFTACEAYRRRVIQLGESPSTVFDVGALGVENVRTVPLMDRQALEADLGFAFGERFLLVTYHPATLAGDGAAEAEAFFAGLETVLAGDETLTAVITGANADPGGSLVDARAAALHEKFPGRTLVTPSLGLVRYLSALRLCAAVAGNSSSGILEAPSFGVPTVNVGDRQKGRVRAESVLDCAPAPEAVAGALRLALSSEGAAVAKRARNPYEKKDTSRRMLAILKQGAPAGAKPFFDIDHCPSKD